MFLSRIGIPKGWERKALGDFAEIKGGKQYGDNELDGSGEVPVFGGNGVQGYSLKYTHSGFLIVFGRVGANCGSVHWSYDGAWVNNNASSVVPDSHNERILQHLLHYDFGHLRKGSAQPFIPNSILSTVQFLIPTEALAIKFCETIRKFRYQQRNLDHQIRLLTQARYELYHGNQILAGMDDRYNPEQKFKQSMHTVWRIFNNMDIFGTGSFANECRVKLAEYLP